MVRVPTGTLKPLNSKQLRSVQASIGAFAALRADGSVVVWGQRGPGGDCTHVQDSGFGSLRFRL